MKISIICPFYNCEGYLSRCITSIIEQSYQDWELILIDDGSTDNSFLNAEAFLFDKRISLYKQNNFGQGVARNYGLSYATGDYVTFVDSDDYLDKNYVRHAVSVISNNDDIDVLSTNYEYVNGEKRTICLLVKNELFLSGIECYRTFLTKNIIHSAPWAKFYSHTFLEKYNIKFPPFRAREDIYFENLVYFYANRIVVSEMFGYYVVLHGDSTEGRGYYIEKTKALEAGRKSIELCKNNNVLIKESHLYFNNLYYFCITEFCLSNKSTDEINRDVLLSYYYLVDQNLASRSQRKLFRLFLSSSNKAKRYCIIRKFIKRFFR